MNRFKVIILCLIFSLLTFNGTKKVETKKSLPDKSMIKAIIKDYEFFKYFHLFKNYDMLANLNKMTNYSKTNTKEQKANKK